MTIRKANQTDYTILAKKHSEVFPGFFLSTLGVSFLQAYYKALLNHPETICLFAEQEGKVVGYVVGRTNAQGFLKRVVKKNPVPFAIQGIKLLFTKPASLIRLINNLDKKRTDNEVEDKQDYAEIALIGVEPDIKGKGVGHTLLRELEKILKTKGIKELSLTTDYYDNENTLRAYKAWGFSVLYVFTTYPDRKMYRLIKTVG